MSNIPEVIITKAGKEKTISKIAWESMGKFTDGWTFVSNADPNDISLPINVKTGAAKPEFIPEEVKDMETLRKMPEMKIGKISIRNFTDQEVMDEYLFRNQDGKNTIITDRETKLVMMEKHLNNVMGLLMPFLIEKKDEDVETILERVIQNMNDKKEMLNADINEIETFINPMFNDEYLTKDARTRLTSVMEKVSELKSHQS